MKEVLDEQSRQSLIKYRIERANETIQESKLLAKEGYYNAGVKTMLGLHFVSKGVLANEHGKTFSRLFEIRHSGDYDDFVYCDQEMVDEYTPKAVSFIAAVMELLK